MSMKPEKYEEIISKLKEELGFECAIANKYGIILASNIKEFSKNKVIPQMILSMITSSKELAKEFNLKEIRSFAFESEKYNFLFTFTKDLILVSRLNLNIDLAKFMPNIGEFLEKLSEESRVKEIQDFTTFDFSREIERIKETLDLQKPDKDKYSIIKDIVNYISS
ncbi:MAG: hypothetical protein ACTSVX_11660 [Promethearchaeota archaeon]